MSRFGQKIVRRLQSAVEKLRGEEQLTCRTVEIKAEPDSIQGSDVRSVRLRLGASQVLFAQFIGVSANTLRSWEQGINKPSGIARRLITEMNRDTPYWKQRLLSVTTLRAPAPPAKSSAR